LVAAAPAAVANAAKQQTNSAAAKFQPPKGNYLALGDSLAFGAKEAKFNSLLPNPDPAAFNSGYVDRFGARLRTIRHEEKTINLSCPGETTDSFLGTSSCVYGKAYSLHQDYTGSQMAAAISFLTLHRKKTSPVSLDIGTNDFLGLYSTCKSNPAPYRDTNSCTLGKAPAVFAHLQQNLDTILTRLRAAARDTEIIVLGVYNPLAPPFRLGSWSDGLAGRLNALMATEAAAHGAHFANPLPVFNPPGPKEASTLCYLLAICNSLGDIHPTEAGYIELANLLFRASRYARLTRTHLPQRPSRPVAGG
jgi:lysophospholipase L1-like esterase